MKGLYICLQDFQEKASSGVNKKIIDQIKALNNLGNDVSCIGTKNKDIILLNNQEFFKIDSFEGKLQKRKLILKNSIKYIKKEKIDFIYIRYFKTDILFLLFLKKIEHLVGKIYLEIPTYPYDSEIKQYFDLKKVLLATNDKCFRHFLKRYVDNVITFSDDKNIWGIKTINIQNGIDVSRIAKKTNKLRDNDKFTLIAVANLSFWHGYDRILKSIAKYYKCGGKKNIEFNIVGKGEELDNLKKFTIDLGLEKIVHFKGIKISEDLDLEFECSDLAIGSLGIHRIGLQSVSTLKLKEYIARGIPFIYAYNDNSISDDFEYGLKFNSNEDEIDFNEIIKFYEKIKFEKMETDMFKLAQTFSWEKQFEKLNLGD